jgi:adenine-specific DNA-methyltransferase
MSDATLREAIQERLKAFGGSSLATAAVALLDLLGYRSDRPITTYPLSATAFTQEYDPEDRLNRAQALINDWNSIDLLFQLSDADVRSALQAQLLLDGRAAYDGAIIQSFIFAAIDLKEGYYTRHRLAEATRAVNRLFLMPVILIFRHGETITLSIIRRRLNQRDESKDVLEKVTLIKDIRYADPLRPHIDILSDLALTTLQADTAFDSFVGLHRAWEKALDSYALTKRFYQDVANWYFWALDRNDIVYPRGVRSEEERSLFLIRLLTRLIFCWFLQEKGLIPADLFRERKAKELLAEHTAKNGDYYKAILQNLFFATLNQEPDQRGFRNRREGIAYTDDYGITNIYRYADLIKDENGLLDLFRQVPFVNGGLFECLDVRGKKPEIFYDDFSEQKANRLCLPSDLFFGSGVEVDLSERYEDQRRRRERVRGIFETFNRYKFTVEENTPVDEEIALDPELLGHVFENLSASYSEDTRTTARKATGSFYTPRQIVSYMVDEALIVYLRGQLAKRAKKQDDDQEDGNDDESVIEANLRKLLDPYDASPNPFDAESTQILIEAIDHLKILDPACGSGAFPMGALQQLLALLRKLDEKNERWKAVQIRRAIAETEKAYLLDNRDERQERLTEIEEVFSRNNSDGSRDYGRKLYLIENCLYGVDIQPIACQIAKLRFFISLIVDQKVDRSAPNFGVRPLPNLETRIVAADSLRTINLPRGGQLALLDVQLAPLRQQLEEVRHEYFTARTARKKQRCRRRDEELRREIADLLRSNGLPDDSAAKLAAWNPYDQNSSADFFDPAWMFGVPVGKVSLDAEAPSTLLGNFAFVKESAPTYAAGAPEVESGFDIVVGNPPYVRQEQIKERKAALKAEYATYSGTADLYVYFYERSVRLLKPGGVLSFITSNKWYRSGYGEKLRSWLSDNLRLVRLIDFGDAPIFTAIAYPTIVIGERLGEPGSVNGNVVRALNWEPGRSIESFGDIVQQESFSLPQRSLPSDGWRLEGQAKRKLLERIQQNGVALGLHCKGRLYWGVKTGLNDAFVIDRLTYDQLVAQDRSSQDLLKPFLRGRDIKRWRTEPQDIYLIFTRRGVDINRYPAIHDYLLQFKPRLEPGVPGGRKPGTYKWYEIQDNIAYWQEFSEPKVIIPAISNGVNYAPDLSGYYCNNKATIAIPPSVNYAVAVLNSPVSWWFAQQVFASKQGGFYDFEPRYSGQTPIPNAEASQQKTIEVITEYVIWQYTQTENREDSLLVGYFEQLLNGLVYELFFPDELHAQKLTLFRFVEEVKLPSLASMPEAERAERLAEIFERLYDNRHPVRGALQSLRNLESVRIIEGESE